MSHNPRPGGDQFHEHVPSNQRRGNACEQHGDRESPVEMLGPIAPPTTLSSERLEQRDDYSGNERRAKCPLLPVPGGWEKVRMSEVCVNPHELVRLQCEYGPGR